MVQMNFRKSYDEIFTKAVNRYNSDNLAQRAKAFSTFLELEKVGHVSCLKYLANCYLNGRGCDQNVDKAREYLIVSIALGHYNDAPKPTSYEMIRRIDGEIYGALEEAENTFNSNVRDDACVRAMYINYVNSIVYGNNKKIAWLRLGDMYHYGIGVPVKKNWSAYCYRRAYISGGNYDEIDDEILYKIGKCFFYGDGVEKDYSLAKCFLRMVWDYWNEYEYLDKSETLLSAIGHLDESLWSDDYGINGEEEYLEDIYEEWLCTEPDYI